jgi:hypothetical protein
MPRSFGPKDPASSSAVGQRWLLTAFFLIYLGGTGALAALKCLWYDELCTFHIAHLPRLEDVWSSLCDGTDLNPPLYYLAARGSAALCPNQELAARMPALLGFGVMCLCLFGFVSRRCPPVCAWVALLFPLTTEAYTYAFEARPYGLVLGLGALALFCWQSAVEGRHRRASLVGLAMSLSAALFSHYYAVLLFIPLAAGEVVRFWTRRRPDWPMWLALGSPILSLALLLPQMRQATHYGPAFWAPPGEWSTAVVCYPRLLRWGMVFLVFAFILWAFALLSRLGRACRSDYSERSLLAHEWAAVLCLIGLPAVGFLLAKFVTGAFVLRYVMPSVLGFGVLTAVLARPWAYPKSGIVHVLAIAILAYIPGRVALAARDVLADRSRQEQACAQLGSLSADAETVVVADGLQFLEIQYYATPAVAGRLVYVSDLPASLRCQGKDLCDRTLQTLRRHVPLPIEDCGPFLASHHHFVVYGERGWLPRTLVDAGVEVTVRGVAGDSGVYAVTLRGPMP